MNRRGFTLIELLVAIGIIVLLSVIALASTRSLRGSLKFSTAVNTTAAFLERARSEAIRRGEPVMVAFRPVVIGLRDRNGDGVTNEADLSPEDQFGVDVVLLRWTGETVIFKYGNGCSSTYPVDRWVPIPDLKTARLPSGMSVAVPRYFEFPSSDGGNPGDDSWVSPTDFSVRPLGYSGEVPAIMFDETGQSLEDNPNSPSLGPWIDWNDDRVVLKTGSSINESSSGTYPVLCGSGIGSFYLQSRLDDEPFASVSSFLAIFDQAAARAQLNPGQNFEDIVLTGEAANPSYVQREGKILHLNRFSGVVMK